MYTWKEFTKRYGKNTTSNIQLTKWARELGIPFFSCIMRDELSKLPRNKEHNIIINLETSKERGSDWNALFYRPREGLAYYFSSYALPPLEEVKAFTKGCKEKYYNTHSLQELGEKYCGQLALYILYQLSHGIPFEEAILNCKS